MSHYAADMDQQWRDEQQARRESRIELAKEYGTGCGCPEWCDLFNVSMGVPMCGNEWPRCECGRDIRNNGGVI